jgi:predicted MFS family arabinose efflux permease
VRLGIGSTPFLLPLLFQVGFGLSAFDAGLLISPLFIGMLCAKIFARNILKRYGFKKTLLFDSLMISLILISFSLIQSNTSHVLIIGSFFIYGIFVSMQFSSMNALNYVDIAPNTMSKATSIASTMMQLSSCFSVVLAALTIKYFSGFQGLTQHSIRPIHNAFIFTALITLLSVFLFYRLSDSDGASVTGQ